MVTLCIECKKFVNKRQEALLCDGCNKWKHRTCNSGVSRDVYRNAVKSGKDIPWKCKPCSARPNFESTRNEGNYKYQCSHQVTIDFEKALWSVLRQLLPNARIKGCVFHWTRALWRKVSGKY